VNVLSKELCTVDKGWSCGCEITTTKIQNTKYCYTGPPTGKKSVWVLAGIMWLKTGSDGTLL
jgi:hypothetical protein